MATKALPLPESFSAALSAIIQRVRPSKAAFDACAFAAHAYVSFARRGAGMHASAYWTDGTMAIRAQTPLLPLHCAMIQACAQAWPGVYYNANLTPVNRYTFTFGIRTLRDAAAEFTAPRYGLTTSGLHVLRGDEPIAHEDTAIAVESRSEGPSIDAIFAPAPKAIKALPWRRFYLAQSIVKTITARIGADDSIDDSWTLGATDDDGPIMASRSWASGLALDVALSQKSRA